MTVARVNRVGGRGCGTFCLSGLGKIGVTLLLRRAPLRELFRPTEDRGIDVRRRRPDSGIWPVDCGNSVVGHTPIERRLLKRG